MYFFKYSVYYCFYYIIIMYDKNIKFKKIVFVFN